MTGWGYKQSFGAFHFGFLIADFGLEKTMAALRLGRATRHR
jgi:hypothetical protein